MSSQDTMRTAESERSKAQELERQAQNAINTIQQQADAFRQQAKVHMDQYNRLISQAQSEQQREAEQEARQRAEAAQEEQRKRDEREKAIEDSMH